MECLVVLVLLAPGVTAITDGVDFSNNLFSDLGPLLALFGDSFARQFLSESFTWLDHIIFAMAPLGILTAIVSAIRVGGPSWMRALIGRARENRASAEVELMTSTSHEVCELWNGEGIVRTIGKPKVTQIVFLEEHQHDEKFFGLFTLKNAGPEGHHVMEVKDYEGFFVGSTKVNMHKIWTFAARLGLRGKRAKKDVKDKSEHKRSSDRKPCRTDKAPNILLNLHDDHGRKKAWELLIVAVVGTFLQFGVLIFSAFTAYDSRLIADVGRPKASRSAFPLLGFGTIILVLGMLFCSIVIEQSTSEDVWKVKPPTEIPNKENTALTSGEGTEIQVGKPVNGVAKEIPGTPSQDSKVSFTKHSNGIPNQEQNVTTEKDRKDPPTKSPDMRVFWLQKQHIVSDQSFESFMITAQGSRDQILTSRRCEDWDSTKRTLSSLKESHPDMDTPENTEVNDMNSPLKQNTLKILAVVGTATGLVGFVVQFVGFRLTNWSCSIAQLVAISIMTALRAYVRRGLRDRPRVEAVPRHREMDWLALRIVSVPEFLKNLSRKEESPWYSGDQKLRWCADCGKELLRTESSNPSGQFHEPLGKPPTFDEPSMLGEAPKNTDPILPIEPPGSNTAPTLDGNPNPSEPPPAIKPPPSTDPPQASEPLKLETAEPSIPLKFKNSLRFPESSWVNTRSISFESPEARPRHQLMSPSRLTHMWTKNRDKGHPGCHQPDWEIYNRPGHPAIPGSFSSSNSVGKNQTQETHDFQRTVHARKRLGDLTEWEVPASKYAVRVANAIERVMNRFNPEWPSRDDTFTWSLDVRMKIPGVSGPGKNRNNGASTAFGQKSPDEVQKPTHRNLQETKLDRKESLAATFRSLTTEESAQETGQEWKMMAPEGTISFDVQKGSDEKWKIGTREIEAALSLWIHHFQEEAAREEQAAAPIPIEEKDRLRPTEAYSIGRFRRVLGPYEDGFKRKLEWWIGKECSPLLEDDSELREGERDLKDDGKNRGKKESLKTEAKKRDLKTEVKKNVARDEEREIGNETNRRDRMGPDKDPKTDSSIANGRPVKLLKLGFCYLEGDSTSSISSTEKEKGHGTEAVPVETPKHLPTNESEMSKTAAGNNDRTDPAKHSSELRDLVVRMNVPLEHFLSHHMFSAFMWAIANYIPREMFDHATVDPQTDDTFNINDPKWDSIWLTDPMIEQCASDIEATGLGTREEAYLSLIPPLLKMEKLPNEVVVDLVRRNVRDLEQARRWNDASTLYTKLLESCEIYSQDRFVYKAVAAVIEFLILAVTAPHPEESDSHQETDSAEQNEHDLTNVQSALLARLKGRFRDISLSLGQVYYHQDRLEEYEKAMDWQYEDLEVPGSLPKSQNWERKHIFTCLALHDNIVAQRPDPLLPLQIPENIRWTDVLGWAPLHYAVIHCNPDTFQDILDEWTDARKKKDLAERSPVHYAAIHGKADLIKKLLDKGTDVEPERDGLHPLHWASKLGKVQAVRKLLDYPQHVKKRDAQDVWGRTPLHLAAYGGSEVIVEALLGLHADAQINAQDHFDRTPLHLASAEGRSSVVKRLIDDGADITLLNRNKKSALEVAADTARRENAEKVKEEKAKSQNETAMRQDAQREKTDRKDEATQKSATKEAQAEGTKDAEPEVGKGRKGKKSAEKGKDPREKRLDELENSITTLLSQEYFGPGNTRGFDLLTLAAEKDFGMLFRLVLELDRGENSDKKGDNGSNWLHIAAQAGSGEVVKQLLVLWESKLAYSQSDAHDQGVRSKWIKALNTIKFINAIKTTHHNQDDQAVQDVQPLQEVRPLQDVRDGEIDQDGEDTQDSPESRPVAETEHQHRRGGSTNAEDGDPSLPRTGNATQTPAHVSKFDERDEDGMTPLSLASKRNHRLIVEMLLSCGVKLDKNARCSYGRTPISWAAGSGAKEVVELLLRHDVEVNERDNDGRTSLSWAASSGAEEVVELLLNHGDIHIDERDDDGKTPFFWAAEEGHLAVVKILLKADKALLKLVDNSKHLPISRAANNGHTEVLEFLLDHGESVTTVDGTQEEDDMAGNDTTRGRTLLSRAAKYGHEGAVRLLLERGAKINAKSGWYGQTAMSYAADYGRASLVEFLHTWGADIEKGDKDGWGPLMWAVIRQHLPVVQFLMEKGASIYSKDRTDETPISKALGLDTSSEVAQLVLTTALTAGQLDFDAYPEAVYWAKRRFQVAAEEHRTDILRLLINKAWSSEEDLLESFVSWAKENNRTDVIALLVEEVANGELTIRKESQSTPLIHAVQASLTEAVPVLLQRNKNLDAKDRLGRTALSYAVEGDNVDIVKLLLAERANLNDEDNFGCTILSYAVQGGNVDIVEWLLAESSNLELQADPLSILLQGAVDHRNEGIIELLLKKNGASALVPDNQGMNALHRAADSRYEKGYSIFKQLFDHAVKSGNPSDWRDKQGRTLMHHVAAAGSADLVEYLRPHFDNIDDADTDGWTPMHWACRRGDQLTVERLLENGSNPNFHEKLWDWTPLQVAAFYGQKELVLELPDLAEKCKRYLERGLENTDFEEFSPGRFASVSETFCRGCNMRTVGRRFRCIECRDQISIHFDFCSKCMHTQKETHPNHQFEMSEDDSDDDELSDQSKESEVPETQDPRHEGEDSRDASGHEEVSEPHEGNGEGVPHQHSALPAESGEARPVDSLNDALGVGEEPEKQGNSDEEVSDDIHQNEEESELGDINAEREIPEPTSG